MFIMIGEEVIFIVVGRVVVLGVIVIVLTMVVFVGIFSIVGVEEGGIFWVAAVAVVSVVILFICGLLSIICSGYRECEFAGSVGTKVV